MPKHSYDFNISVLRTFVAVQELGSAVRAATKVGRSQSAVSLQLKRLEQQLGCPLFIRSSDRTSLTEFGRGFLAEAIRLIALNDAIAARTVGQEVKGVVRLGMPAWIAETWLPAVLAQFAGTYPAIRIETRHAPSAILASELDRGQLDLAVMANMDRSDALWSREMPLCWIAHGAFVRRADEGAISLVVLDSPCLFRTAAITALERAGMSWKVTFAAKTMATLWAAVSGGLGITLRTPFGIPGQLVAAGHVGLPVVPNLSLGLYGKPNVEQTIAAELMAKLLTEAIEVTIGAAF